MPLVGSIDSIHTKHVNTVLSTCYSIIRDDSVTEDIRVLLHHMNEHISTDLLSVNQSASMAKIHKTYFMKDNKPGKECSHSVTAGLRSWDFCFWVVSFGIKHCQCLEMPLIGQFFQISINFYLKVFYCIVAINCGSSFDSKLSFILLIRLYKNNSKFSV